MRRRDWLRRLAAASVLATPGTQTLAQLAWPSRPLQLIVPWPAAGATDLGLRVLCEEAEPHLGQPIVVVNRPGASGTLVAPLLKAAIPDGHTLGQVPITVYRHALMNSVPWDPLTDLQPIAQVSSVTFGVLVPATSPWKTLADLTHWALAHPDQLLLGSTGIGTTAHLAMEEVLGSLGVRYTHVPYKGTADQMLAMASGQLMAGVNSTGFAPWVDQGKLRLLAIFSAQRSARWPDVPTLRELGHPSAVHTSPWGLAAPAGTPEIAMTKLHDAFRQAMFTTRHRQMLARYDQTLDYLDTRAYRKALVEAVARERQLLHRLHLLPSPPSSTG